MKNKILITIGSVLVGLGLVGGYSNLFGGYRNPIATPAATTSTVWSIQVGSPTSTLKTWRLLPKTVALKGLTCGIDSASGIAFKLWYSTDFSGASASATLGTFVCQSQTTGDYTAMTTTIPYNNYLILEATEASGTAINNLSVDIGGL